MLFRSPTFCIGGPDTSTPGIAVGDTYSAITKLTIGSYTSPGTNSLSVIGNVSIPGFFFCAGVVGSTATNVRGTGQVTFTVARTSGQAAGGYTITFASAHPLGATYIVNLTGQYSLCTLNGGVAAQSFKVMCYTPGTSTLVDSAFHFQVLVS